MFCNVWQTAGATMSRPHTTRFLYCIFIYDKRKLEIYGTFLNANPVTNGILQHSTTCCNIRHSTFCIHLGVLFTIFPHFRSLIFFSMTQIILIHVPFILCTQVSIFFIFEKFIQAPNNTIWGK